MKNDACFSCSAIPWATGGAGGVGGGNNEMKDRQITSRPHQKRSCGYSVNIGSQSQPDAPI